MALIFRQQITTNRLEILALYNAISAHIFKPFRSDRKVSLVEFLSAEPLRKVASRLHTKYLKEQYNLAHQFSFSFSPQELLAIHHCIRNTKQNHFLISILMKIQQKVLNFENYAVLHHVSSLERFTGPDVF
jgi:hypothetical protein